MIDALAELRKCLTDASTAQAKEFSLKVAGAGIEGARLIAAMIPEIPVESLTISPDGMGDAEWGIVAPAIAQLRLSRLNFFGATFAHAGFSELARVLDQIPTLETLDLRGAKLGAAGLFELKPALERMHGLRSLGMRYTALNRASCVLLGPALAGMPQLESLNLASNSICSEGFGLLASSIRAMPKLRRLNLWGNGIGKDQGITLANALAPNSALETLGLGCNGVRWGSEFAQALQRLHRLTDLDVSSADFVPADFDSVTETIASLANLVELDVSHISFGRNCELFLSAMSNPDRLQRLNLGSTDLTPECAIEKTLPRFTHLRELRLPHNAFGNAGVEALIPALGELSELSHLVLMSVHVNDDIVPPLTQHLKNFKELTTLDLKWNPFSRRSVDAITAAVNALPKPCKLEIDAPVAEPSSFSRADFAARMESPNLDFDSLKLGDADCGRLAEALEDAAGAESLNLRNNRIGAEGIKQLASVWGILNSLRGLSLGYNPLGDAGTTALIAALEPCSELVGLDLTRVGLTAAGMPGFSDALSRHTGLQHLGLGFNNLAGNSFGSLASALGRLSKLQSLNLSFCELGPEESGPLSAGLAELGELQTLILNLNAWRPTGIERLSAGLRRLSQLQSLHLNDGKMAATGATALAECFSKWPELRQLSLSSNQLDGAAANSIGRTLGELKDLAELDLSFNDIDDLRILGPALRHLQRLESLDFSRNELTPPAVEPLLRGLSESVLSTLQIGSNHLGNVGVRWLAVGLEKFPALIELDLHSNEIAEAAANLGEALPGCPSLRRLDLSFNAISDQELTALARALALLPEFASLDLRHNSMSDDGVRALAWNLRGHPGLESLQLDGNSLSLSPDVLATNNPQVIFDEILRR